jgi:hypothetical protein
MQVHHRVESTAYFPQFQAIEPGLSRGFDLLETDHHEIDRILYELAETGRAGHSSAETARGAGWLNLN